MDMNSTLAETLDYGIEIVEKLAGINLEEDLFDHLGGQALIGVRDFEFDRAEDLCPSNIQVAIAKMSEELTKPYEERRDTLQAIESEIKDLDQRQARVMEAFEAGTYTVDDYSRRMAPLRATEAELKEKRTDVARELDHQTAVLAKPEEVLQFVAQLSDFLDRSSPKDRKQMLNRFIKCIWIESRKGTVIYRIPLPQDAKRTQATEVVLALDEASTTYRLFGHSDPGIPP